jgi:protein-tyrosine phosphatase
MINTIPIENQAARYLQWEACFNTRELGGFQTQDNKQTRWRAFIRSDTLSRLTKCGQEMLVAYGITTIFDLRFPRDAVNDPSPFQGQKRINSAPQYLHLPMFDDLDERDISDLSVEDLMSRDPLAAFYCGAIDRYQQNIARIFQEVVQHPQGAILFHCHSGQDRTGILAAFLLALAGVPAAVIAEDYALSTGYLRPMYQQMLEEAANSPEKREDLKKRLKRILTPETMCIVLSYIESHYGGVVSFLRYTGVTDQEIAHLRSRLVE